MTLPPILCRLTRFCTGLLLAGPILSAAALAEAPRSILVMDGSGSMWGQIEGRPKLEIARDTVATVLGSLPAGQELGLMAYGHREKGNCSDIELIVPPAPDTGPGIAAAVGRMRFLGKTPLSEAVRQAAETLRYGEAAATVVLVTDGLETCDADPCALGRELESSGLNFTAHVIGFGLTGAEGAQVACLATETGGQYLEAGNAGALVEALTTAVTPPQEEIAVPAQRRYYPGSPEMQGIALSPTGRTTGAAESTLADFAFPATGSAADCAALCTNDRGCAAWRYEPPGSLFVEEARCFAFPAASEMDYQAFPPEEGWASGIKDGVLMLIRPYAPAPILPTASLTFSETAPAGSLLRVAFDGPHEEFDHIRVLDAGGNWLAETAVDGDPFVDLRLPFRTGLYEVVYSYKSEEIIARAPLTLSEAPVSITAPDTAQVGSTVTITWVGPEAFLDNIQLWNADTGERWGYDYTEGKNSMDWTMPDLPGRYEFRYVFLDSETIHTRPITVTLDRVDAIPTAGPALVPVALSVPTDYANQPILWSAEPLDPHPAVPEAVAMPEPMTGPWTTDLYLGRWRIYGEASSDEAAGQAFGADITVTEAAGQAFEIPLAPFETIGMGEDAPSGNAVVVTIRAEGFDGPVEWSATPEGETEDNRLADTVTGGWHTSLSPGEWAIFGMTDNATFFGRITVDAGQTNHVIPREGQIVAQAQSDAEIAYRCDGPEGCLLQDAATGLGFTLPAGWVADTPVFSKTAAGVTANQPMMGFIAPDGARIELNPIRWSAENGRCRSTAAGTLCHWSNATATVITAFNDIALSLTLSPTTQGQMESPPPADADLRLDLSPETAAALRARLTGEY